jgi:hypothetical protein
MADIKIKEGSPVSVEFTDDDGNVHTADPWPDAVWDARTSDLVAHRAWVNPAGHEVPGRRVEVDKVIEPGPKSG